MAALLYLDSPIPELELGIVGDETGKHASSAEREVPKET
jgi:hypothetical protein